MPDPIVTAALVTGGLDLFGSLLEGWGASKSNAQRLREYRKQNRKNRLHEATMQAQRIASQLGLSQQQAIEFRDQNALLNQILSDAIAESLLITGGPRTAQQRGKRYARPLSGAGGVFSPEQVNRMASVLKKGTTNGG